MVLFLFIGPQAYANDYCTPVNMTEAGGSLEHVRAHNQGELNICTFNSLAQMIDANRFDQNGAKDNHVTSPLALAVNRHSVPVKNNLRDGRKNFFFEYSGTTCQSFNLIHDNDYGSCNEASVVREIAKESADTGSSLTKYFSRASAGADLNEGLAVIDTYVSTMEDCELHPETRVGDNILMSIAEMREAIERMGDDRGLKRTIANACTGGNKKDLNMTCESELETIGGSFWEQQSYGIDVIHSKLQSDSSQPIALTMCMQALTSKGHKMGLTRNSKGPYVQSNCSQHTLLIAGRRRAANGECQILLRNSTNIPCYRHANPRDCEDGGYTYWISENELEGNITDIVTLKKK